MQIFEAELKNASASGGRARLLLLNAAAHFGDATAIAFTVRRGDVEKPFLSPAGWSASEHRFEADSAAAAGTSLMLEIGPAVVNNIDEYTQVIITFPDFDAALQLVWTGVIPSIEGVSRGPIVQHDETDHAEDEKRKRIEAEQRAKRQQEEQDRQELEERNRVEEERKRQARKEAADAAESKDDQVDPKLNAGTDDKPGKSRLLFYIGGGVFTAFLIGAVAWFLFFRNDLAPGDPLAEKFAKASTMVKRNQCEKAREIFTELDAADYGPSLTFMAQQIDSFDFKPCLRQASNDVQAIGLLVRACVAGDEKAGRALVSFKSRLEQSGDPVALEVLRLKYPEAASACGLG